MILAILDRYLLREVLRTFAAATLVLLLIIFGNLFMRLLRDAMVGRLPAEVIGPLLILGGLQTLILLLPVALFLAIMLTLGRLYRDSERVAMQAAGVGEVRLYRPLFVLALPVAILLTGLVAEVVPWASGLADQLKQRAREYTQISSIAPGRFIESRGGEIVVFAESADHAGHTLSNVFIHVVKDGRTYIETAPSARQEFHPLSQEPQVVLENGQRYQGIPGEGEFEILSFARHHLRIPPVSGQGRTNRRDSQSLWALWRSGTAADMAEIQWRLSVPVSVVVLVLLAVPLSRTTPRAGRFAKLAVAIIIYILYANLVLTALSWTRRGAIPLELGVWWVHAGFGLLAMILLARPLGVRLRRQRFTS